MDSKDESTFELLSEISPSQEQILQTCSFTRKHEYFSGDEDSVGEYESTVPMYETPVESTGIIMISLQKTPIDETISQQDHFQTPPEGPNLNDGDGSVNGEEMYKDCDLGFSQSQSQTGSENLEINVRVPGIVESGDTLFVDEKVVDLELGGEPMSVDLGGEKLSVDTDCLKGNKIVDLDNDKLIVDLDNYKVIVDLGNNKLNVGLDNICDPGVETLFFDDDCQTGEKMVDLNNDCNLVQTKEPVVDLVDGGETLAVEDDLLQGEKLVDLDTDCNVGQTKDPIADLVDGDQTLCIEDHCLEGEKMVDLDMDTEDQPLSNDQIVATTVVAHDSDCEKMVHLDKDTEDQALSDFQIVEQLTTVVDFDTDETTALPDCEKTVDLGKYLVSDNALTEDVELELQEITGDNKVELQESSNGKDDVIKETEKSIIRVAEAIGSDTASSSGVNVDKRKKKNKKKKKTSEISIDLPKRGRELPASIIGGVDNVKEAETTTDFLMNLLKSLAKKPAPKKDDDNGDNMVITAMKRGLTFPRPRSWPPGYRPSWFPEGYDCVG